MPLPHLRQCCLVALVAFFAPSFIHAQLGGKITELGSGGRSFNDAKPDIAYDPVNDYYAHIFEGGVKPHSIRLKLFQAATGSGVSGGDVGITGSTQDNINPCVAYIAKSGLFLVAWQTDNNGNWDIQCRAYDPTAKSLGPIVTVASTAGDEITPDIASESTKLDDDAVLVWDDESVGIRAVEIEVPSLTGVKVLTPKTLAVGAKPLHNNPAIARSGGAARRIAVAWETAAASVAVQAFTMDLAAASTPLAIPVSASFPQLDGNGSEFLVVFQRPQPNTPTRSDVWCCAVKIPLVPQLPLIQAVAPRALGTQINDERHPVVSFVGGSYLTAWAVVNTGDQFGKVQLQTVTPDCLTCGQGWLVQYGNRQRTVDWQAVASVYNSDATTNVRRARVMYDTGYIGGTPPTSRSLCQKVNYEVVGGAKSSLAASCGGGGTLSIPGPFAFGEPVDAQLTGASTSATNALFVIGLPGARTQFPCGSCSILLGPFIFGVTVSGGQAQWPARIPCDAALNNVDMDCQYVVFTPGTSPCPLAPGLSASNILRATVQ